MSQWSENIWKMLQSFDEIPSCQRQKNCTISNDHNSLVSIRDSAKITDAVQVHVSSHAAVLFHVGDLVQIVSRTWPGINKPGGMGWIIKRNEYTDSSGDSQAMAVGDGSFDSYDVKYIIDSRVDTNISAMFISAADVDLFADNSSTSAVVRTSGRKRSSRVELTPVSTGSRKRNSPAGDSVHHPTPPTHTSSVVEAALCTPVEHRGPRLATDMVVVSTGLNPRDQKLFAAFRNMFSDSIRFGDKLDMDTSVVVISGSSADNLVVEKRTMKYMNAIMSEYMYCVWCYHYMCLK